MDEPTDPTLLDLRRALDEVDEQIVAALNRRFELVRRIGVCKSALGMPVRDKQREAEVLERVARDAREPLSTRSVHLIFRVIMCLARRCQNSNPKP